MKNRYQFITAICFLFACVPISAIQAQSTEALTIDSCYASARRNIPLIKQFDLIEKSLDYNLNNANKAYLPQLSITGIGGYVFGGLPSFAAPGASAEENNVQFIGIGQLNQTIWDGGATKTQKNISQASSDIEKSTVEVSIYGIKERVNQIFFSILLIDEQMTQHEIQRELLQKNFSKAATLKENGLVYKNEVDELRAELLRADQKVIEFNYARKGYVKMLSYLINKSLDDQVKLETPSDKTSLLNVITRPELQLFASQKKLASAQSAINRVHTMPKIGLLGAGALFSPGIQFGPSDLSSIAIAGLSLSWNTSGLYKISNNAQLTKLNLSKIDNQQEQFLFNTNLQLIQIRNELDKKNAIYLKDEEIVELRASIRITYQLKYDNGLCSMNDLISSANKESEARANKALHKIDWLLSVYQYNNTNGN